MTEPTSFSERLAALIEEGGATHGQVARWMKVHRVAVTVWLSGKTEPRGGADAIEHLASFFGCSPEWLYFGRGKRPSASTVKASVHDAIAELGPDASDPASEVA